MKRRRITLITNSVIQPTFDRLRAFHDKTYLRLIGSFRNKFPVSEREQVTGSGSRSSAGIEHPLSYILRPAFLPTAAHSYAIIQ